MSGWCGMSGDNKATAAKALNGHPDVSLPGVLVVADAEQASTLQGLCGARIECLTASDWPSARVLLASQWIGLVVVAIDAHGNDVEDRIAWLRELGHDWPEVLSVVRIVGVDASDMARLEERLTDCPRLFHVLRRECCAGELERVLGHALRLYHLERECERLKTERKLFEPTVLGRLEAHRSGLRDAGGFETILRGPDSPLNRVCDMAARIAGFDVPVLVMGETGTGKELMARAIHASSLRSDKPFHAVNCGAVADELLESELFGHCKGAFTGAHVSRIGMLEQAHGGTILLDEIGDISPAFQIRLLRFLQEGEVRPAGTNGVRRVDARIIAATNRDLAAEVAAGRFREDLYHRLVVAPVTVPPLRERRGDIALLAETLLARVASAHGLRIAGFSHEAMAYLRTYSWPGNVRELENQITRMAILSTGTWLGGELLEPHVRGAGGVNGVSNDAYADHPHDEVPSLACSGVADRVPASWPEALTPTPTLPSTPPTAEPDGRVGGDTGDGTLREKVERMEVRCLVQALERHCGNKTRAAGELGISRIGLRAKLQRYGIG